LETAVRRRTLFVALVGLAVMIASGAVVLWPRTIVAGLTQENFDRIEVGMTRPEVEALLGKPWCQDGGGVSTGLLGNIAPAHPDWGVFSWDDPRSPRPEDRGSTVSVSFDVFGRVSSKYSEKFIVKEPFSIHGLLWRAKRQWRSWFPE
jgi:hypothetical protein